MLAPAPFRVLCTALIAASLLWSAPADARDMTGKAGLGFCGRLLPSLKGSATALTFRYWRQTVAIELIAGFDWDITFSQLQEARRFHGGVGVIYRIFDSPRVSAGLGGRLFARSTTAEVESQSVAVQVANDGQVLVRDELSQSTMHFEVVLAVPFQVEVFLSDHSAIQAAVGIAFIAAAGGKTPPKDGKQTNPFRDADGGRVELAGQHSGGIGYTYYF